MRPLTDVLTTVRRTIETYNLLANGNGVVVGVSGGPDSLCLLHVLLRLRETYGLRLFVAHLHHGARGEAADADADSVARVAEAWGLPVWVERQDVPTLARQHRLAFEEAARRVRYAFLARLAGEVGAQKIAVGHNADDQAETVLMHFLRGAGPTGLRGMLPLTPITDYRLLRPFSQQPASGILIIRPLLELSRGDVERYCDDQGLQPRFDRSNLDTTYFRNRLRHELLPLLETYNPNIRARLCHTSAVVAADYKVLIQLRDRAWADVVREASEGAVVLDRFAWQALPVALQRAILRDAVYRLRSSLRDVSFCHVEDARRVGLTGQTGAQAVLPRGLVLTVGYETLRLADKGDAGPPPDEPLLWADESLAVQLPGVTPVPRTDWVLRAELLDECDWDRTGARPDPWMAAFDRDALGQPLVLRPRRRGDRFRPRGLGGHHAKLSAFMINGKVPRRWRDRVPLLVAGDTIVWVCGRRVALEGCITPETRRVARFWFERVSESFLE